MGGGAACGAYSMKPAALASSDEPEAAGVSTPARRSKVICDAFMRCSASLPFVEFGPLALTLLGFPRSARDVFRYPYCVFRPYGDLLFAKRQKGSKKRFLFLFIRLPNQQESDRRGCAPGSPCLRCASTRSARAASPLRQLLGFVWFNGWS